MEGPEFRIWLNPGVVSPPTPAVDLGRICFGSAMPTCMEDHESLEAGGALVQVKWKWMWLR